MTAIPKFIDLMVGRDVLSDGEAKQRIDICRQCDQATRNPDQRYIVSNGLTSKSQCMLCSCIIKYKTKLKYETCPMGKW